MAASIPSKPFRSGVLCSFLAVCVGMSLSGCSRSQPIVIGPSPAIPLADPADYRHIRTSVLEPLATDEAPVPFWRPVGVRRTDEGLAVDFLIEAETSEGAGLIAAFLSYCFRHRHDGPDWIEFRNPGGEVFHLEPGCVTAVKRTTASARITLPYTWGKRDDSVDGHRVVTTALFRTDRRYEPGTIEIRFNVVPQFSRMEPWRPACGSSTAATAGDGLVSDPGEWMCFSVRDVGPWVMPR